MTRLKRYFFLHFGQLFFSLFFVLFFISSVVLFIKISGITSVVSLTFGELFLLYLYSLPTILFFTIPITFFASGMITLAKLSYDYELLVLFSLRLNPRQIHAIFLPSLIAITVLLLLLSLALIPLSKQQYKHFLNEKHRTASLNIKPSEFGQRFGEWLVYIDDMEGDNQHLRDIVLFSQTALDRESFLVAETADLGFEQNYITLALQEGSAIAEENGSLWQMNYQTMILRDELDGSQINFNHLTDYWGKALQGDKKRAKDLSISLLTALFPLISFYFVLIFGIHNPRYEKNRSYLYIIVICGAYYGLIYTIGNTSPLLGTILLPPVWLLMTRLWYRRQIGRYY